MFVDGWKATSYQAGDIEDGPLGFGAIKVDKSELKHYQGGRNNPEIFGILQRWYGQVLNYTNRSLTFPLDRILVISALASEFGRVLDDVYLAGM